MSLCPNYCDCRTCKHGEKLCEDCGECRIEQERRRHQQEHEASVKRQRAKIKRARPMESAAVKHKLTIVGIILMMFACEVCVLIGILMFVLGAINDQFDASVLGFLIAVGCGWFIKCLIDPLDKVLSER